MNDEEEEQGMLLIDTRNTSPLRLPDAVVVISSNSHNNVVNSHGDDDDDDASSSKLSYKRIIVAMILGLMLALTIDILLEESNSFQEVDGINTIDGKILVSNTTYSTSETKKGENDHLKDQHVNVIRNNHDDEICSRHVTNEMQSEPRIVSLQGYGEGSQHGVATHVRLALSACPTELIVHFSIRQSVEIEPKTCTALMPGNTEQLVVAYTNKDSKWRIAKAIRVGCVLYPNEIWHFFFAVLTDLENVVNFQDFTVRFIKHPYKIGVVDTTNNGALKIAAKREFEIGIPNRSASSSSSSDPEVYAIVGDVDISKEYKSKVFEDLAASKADLFIHLGDASYATNDGGCYGITTANCQWNCPMSNPNCQGRFRQEDAKYRVWSTWLDRCEKVSSRIPMMTTNGNHDNDLTWFLKFRPPTNTTLPNVLDTDVLHLELEELDTLREMMNVPTANAQILINEIMSRPYFYSFDRGSVHFSVFGTEDNAINPYEWAENLTLSPENQKRFDDHYGVNSPQYKWLRRDLEKARGLDSKTSWLVLITHRPLYSASTHHPSCKIGGDWYLCHLQNLYSKLFDEFDVNFVFSGHSHTFQVSHPLKSNKRQDDHGTVYVVCGTGGYELSGGFDDLGQKFLYTSGRSYGYCKLNVYNSTTSTLDFIGSKESFHAIYKNIHHKSSV